MKGVVFVGDRKLELRAPAMWCLHAHPGLCLATARAVRSRQLNCLEGEFLGAEVCGDVSFRNSRSRRVPAPVCNVRFRRLRTFHRMRLCPRTAITGLLRCSKSSCR